MNYTKAPLAELIIGVNFNGPVLLADGTFFSLLADLSKTYPYMQTLAPLAVDKFDNGLLEKEINQAHSGDKLYRFKSKDETWLVQTQWNKLFLNWTNPGGPRSGYPGFEVAFQRFLSLYDGVKSQLNLTHKHIESLELSYVDKVYPSQLPEGMRTISDFTHFPSLTLEIQDVPFGNANNRIHLIESIPTIKDGYIVMNFGNSFEFEADRHLPLIDFQFMVRGRLSSNEGVKEWFAKANHVQKNVFESVFKDEIKKAWE